MQTRVLFKLSASIAAYKACSLISRLVKEGHEVQVVTSTSAFEFVGEATLEGLTGKPVFKSVFERGKMMDHIHLIKWADSVILCPATANQINKFAHGIGDDILGTLFLAHDFMKPYWIVPAMNEKMWLHPATQKSVTTLKTWGIRFIEPRVGHQACGDYGPGRMAEPEDIYTLISTALSNKEIQV
jgi:phosphopantothenoylcysteine synthetase/decarboxylase